VLLLSASKTQSIQTIQELYDFRHRDFGESRVLELLKKRNELPDDIRFSGGEDFMESNMALLS
jgi:uncharacterized pyridoxal phosphate-containing UPF0001 family protein